MQAVFLIYTTDRKGLLAEITSFFYEQKLSIIQCQQYTDTREGTYFMRLCIDLSDLTVTHKVLEEAFANFALKVQINWQVFYQDHPNRVAVLVSRTSHCLYDLLVKVQEGDLGCEIPLIISNHPFLEQVADKFKIPFYCFPIINGNKKAQEAQILDLLKRHHIDLVVMARYMQVLSEEFIGAYPQKIINIHHAFLPAFQGGNPYVRAWERGVKMIGATAHYATGDLDEGPIIEQDVERVNHEMTPEAMKIQGKDIERRVLSRAVKAHLDHRVIVSGRRTIVFAE